MINIDKLHQEIEHLRKILESYKKEVKMLRAEYAQMKQERDIALEYKIQQDSTIVEGD